MSHLTQARAAVQKIPDAREEVRSAWREYESATLEIEQARQRARTDVPPEPHGRAALGLVRGELCRIERKTKAKGNLQTVVSEVSGETSDAEAGAYRHLAEHATTITGDPVSEARISRAWMSAVRQLDAGVDWNTILANAEARHATSRRPLKSAWPWPQRPSWRGQSSGRLARQPPAAARCLLWIGCPLDMPRQWPDIPLRRGSLNSE